MWRETAKGRIEDKIDKFIIGLDVASKAIRAKREEREREEMERRAALARRREQERQEAYERKLGEDLEAMAARWNKASEIEAFLMAVDEAFPEETRRPEVSAWLEWATGYARRLDPLSDPGTVPKLLDPEQLPPPGVP